MKAIIVLLSLFFGFFLAHAQVTVTKASLTNSNAPDTTVNKSLKNHRKEIQDVILREDIGVIRGIEFGANVSKVREIEKAQFVADGKDFAIFNVAINEKEYAEIIYYLDENRNVKGFGIEFIIKEEDFLLEENLVNDFQAYFTERYGKYKVNARNDEVWDGGNYWIEMGDSSEGGSVLEIEIEIFSKK